MAAVRIEAHRGQMQEAERLARLAHDICLAAQGEEHPDFARVLHLLAWVVLRGAG